jgi:hypothetical protein
LDILNKNNDWVKAFFQHGVENEDKTVDLISEVLNWRKEFGCKGKLIELFYPYSFVQII